METFKIYQILNTINDKSYIGFTSKTIDARWKSHLYSAKKGSHYRIHSAIRKYGETSFVIKLLEESLDGDYALNVLESKYIKSFDSILNGYNTKPGGNDRGWSHTEQTKQKMSDNNYWNGRDRSGENNPMYGKHHTTESLVLMSAKKKGTSTRLGAILTEDTKNKIGTKARERYDNGFINPRKGVILTIETKKLMSETKKGKVSWSKSWELTSPTGEVYQIDNLAKFCRDNSLSASNLGQVAKGKLPHHKRWLCTELSLPI